MTLHYSLPNITLLLSLHYYLPQIIKVDIYYLCRILQCKTLPGTHFWREEKAKAILIWPDMEEIYLSYAQTEMSIGK